MEKRVGSGERGLSRRKLLLATMSLAVLGLGGVAMRRALRRPVPSTGEPLPVIGLGSWQTFDVSRAESARAPLREVLREFAARGGKVVDSSPMYGQSETVLGDLAADLGLHKQLFLATKVWTTGRNAGARQMKESMRRLRAQQLDLMQVHNLVDWRTHLATLRRWKDEGKVRHIGVTHYTASAHGDLGGVLETEDLDFVQLNYSIVEREAEHRLLPLAAQRRVAVLVNRPFAAGALFRKMRGKPLPPWAGDIGCASWAQFFLKFIVSHPAVTCAIPATSRVEHLIDNMEAGMEPLPDAATRERMARVVEEI